MCAEIIFRGPLSTCPPLEKSLGHHIFKQLSIDPDHIFQYDPYSNTSYTRGQIKILSIRVALEFKRLGLKKGDILTLATRNHKNTVLPLLAAIYLGVTVNLLDEVFNKFELKRLIENTKPKMILCDASGEEKFRGILTELDLNIPVYLCDQNFEENFMKPSKLEDQFEPVEVDIRTSTALILCSSGTTGFIKGTRHTHYSIYHAGYDMGQVASKDDRILSSSTIVWSVEIRVILYCINFGATRVSINWYTITPEEILETIQKYKITFMVVTPAELGRLLRHKDFEQYRPTLNNLREIWSIGSPNTKEHMMNLRESFPKVHVINAIGCTELAMLMTYFDSKTEYDLNVEKVNSNGKLCPGVIAKVVDVKTGQSLGKNEQGELLLKAECLTPGYFNNPEANKNAFTEDGWFRTGDLVYFDDDECLFVVGRLKEIFKYDTFYICPAEIEYVINKHPAVSDSCVVGIPDELYGELPMAIIVRKNKMDVTEDEIIKFVDQQVSYYERLRGGVRFIDEFPRTASGKVRKFELKKLLEVK